MYNNNERNEKKDRSKVRWELSDIRDELKFALEDLYDDLKVDIEDLRDEADDIKDDLRDDLDDLLEERESLLKEVGDFKSVIGQYGENAKDKIEHAKEKLERLKLKIKSHEAKFNEKVRKKVEKAKKKAARINISVNPDTSEEWREWAEGLGASLSEVIRESMKFVKNNIGDIAKLDDLGRKLEYMGEDIEQALKNSGIEELGEKLEKEFGKKKGKQKIKKVIILGADKKEKIKKRASGMIKLLNSLPIEKLAQTLDMSNEEAENIIYELVDEGIEGTLEEGVFKFTSPSEEVISKLNKIIDKM